MFLGLSLEISAAVCCERKHPASLNGKADIILLFIFVELNVRCLEYDNDRKKGFVRKKSIQNLILAPIKKQNMSVW